MLSKELMALLLIGGGILCGSLVTTFSHRCKDLFFVALVILAPVTENYDVNFVSREWYRGTVRGFEFSLVDIISVSLLVGLLLRPFAERKRLFWVPSLGLILLLICYYVINIAFADPKLFGLFELSRVFRVLVVFLVAALYVRGEREVKILIFAWALIVLYQGYLSLEQRYVYGIHRVFGTVVQANSLSAFFCTTTPVLVAALNSRIPLLLKVLCAVAIGAACVGEVLTISRTGAVVFATVLAGVTLATMSFTVTVRKVVISLLVVAGIAGIIGKSWETLAARFGESTIGEEYGNKRVLGRGYYIRVATEIARHELLGVGLNNWSYWVSNKYGPRLGYRFVPYKGIHLEPSDIVPPTSNVDMAQAAPAHNLAALTLGELGYPGLILFLLLWARWFLMGASFLWPRNAEVMSRLPVGLMFGLAGMFLQCLTEWVFRQSPLYFLTHILLGALAGLYWVKRMQAKDAAEEQTISDPRLISAADHEHLPA